MSRTVDRVERGCLATFELTDDDVDDLQRARHAQPDKRGLDAVDEGGRGQSVPGHHAFPFTAMTRPSAS